jgi:predicted GTPase
MMKEVALPVSQIKAKQMEIFMPSIATMQLSVLMEVALLKRVNVALVGEGSCGKSSLMRELFTTQFSRFADLDLVSTSLYAQASLKSF